MATFRKIDGKFLKVGAAFATAAGCCCPDATCLDVQFHVETSSGYQGGATPCTPCDPPFVAQPNIGTLSWTASWEEPSSLAGATYKLYRKAGTTACPNCEDAEPDLDSYELYGTYFGPEAIVISRGEISACDENQFRCWALEVEHPSGFRLVCCAESVLDYNYCDSCCSIAFSDLSSTNCDPFEGGTTGTQSASASFAISIPDHDYSNDCDDFFGDGSGVTWEIFFNGISGGTGTGLTGSGSATGFSCGCPTEDPCAQSVTVEVTWCAGAVCCAASTVIPA